MQKRISVDIDAVIAGFTEEFYNRGLIPKDHVITKWDDPYIRAIYPLLKKIEEFWLNLPVIDTIPKGITPSYYLTSREIPKQWTEAWLWRNGFPHAPVIVAEDKALAMRVLNIDLHIDDSLFHFNEINGMGKVNRTCLLYDRTWNQGVETDLRIKKLEDIL